MTAGLSLMFDSIIDLLQSCIVGFDFVVVAVSRREWQDAQRGERHGDNAGCHILGRRVCAVRCHVVMVHSTMHGSRMCCGQMGHWHRVGACYLPTCGVFAATQRPSIYGLSHVRHYTSVFAWHGVEVMQAVCTCNAVT